MPNTFTVVDVNNCLVTINRDPASFSYRSVNRISDQTTYVFEHLPPVIVWTENDMVDPMYRIEVGETWFVASHHFVAKFPGSSETTMIPQGTMVTVNHVTRNSENVYWEARAIKVDHYGMSMLEVDFTYKDVKAGFLRHV